MSNARRSEARPAAYLKRVVHRQFKKKRATPLYIWFIAVVLYIDVDEMRGCKVHARCQCQYTWESSVLTSRTDQFQRWRFQIREVLRLALKVVNRVPQFFDLLEDRAEVFFLELIASVPTKALNHDKSFTNPAFFRSLGRLQVGSAGRGSFNRGCRLTCSRARGE